MTGEFVKGDPESPPTTMLNILWLKYFVWKHAVFRVTDKAAQNGYRVGYRTHDGTCRIQDRVLHHVFVRMRIGHEGCTFFAVDRAGNEVWPFKFVTVVDRKDETYAGCPLV